MAAGIVIATNLSLTQVSCVKDYFDPAIVDTIIKQVSPVHSIDETHTWELASHSTVSFSANMLVGAKLLQVLTENPRESGDAVVVGQTDIADGGNVTLTLSYPTLCTTLYAALVDADGAYTVTAFSPEDSRVDFSAPVFVSERIAYTPPLQTYSYCYEEEFPEPGDYDYNDVVLHISQVRTGERELQINVQLAAVGADNQIAACLRLIGYEFGDIESITTVNDDSFNKGVPKQLLGVQTKRDVLLKGLNNEAVINLFCDAHWATGDVLTESYGYIQRKKYNVSNNPGSDNVKLVPRTITYVVTFVDGSRLNEFTLDTLDPFIIKEYNGGRFEVHMNEYRFAQTLYEYSATDIKNLPWALKVPTGKFCHPLAGQNIGFIMEDIETGDPILFGAYMREGKSFGEWAADHTQCTDWYFYPSANRVFNPY